MFVWDYDFDPYPSQKEFMSRCFEILDQSKVGILESPTGTGKSLSLVSSVLYWRHLNSNLNVDDLKHIVYILLWAILRMDALL